MVLENIELNSYAPEEPKKIKNDTQYGWYYECHITIEPVFDEVLETVKNIAKTYQFKVADLYMQKDRQGTAERSQKDTFMTSHSTNLNDIKSRMRFCQEELELAGIKVWRCKVEDIVLDEKYDRI